MRQRFVATITPTPDSMRVYIEAALGYLDNLNKSRSNPKFCVEEATRELKEALDYLGFFRGADDVLIVRAMRIEGDIGQKRVVGHLQFRDLPDDVVTPPPDRGALVPAE